MFVLLLLQKTLCKASGGILQYVSGNVLQNVLKLMVYIGYKLSNLVKKNVKTFSRSVPAM